MTPSISTKSTPAKDINPDDYAKPFLEFINNNPTVFHTIDYCSKRLDQAGFTKLFEKENWSETLQVGGKYYITRNGSSLVAFTIPSSYIPGNGVGKCIIFYLIILSDSIRFNQP